MQVEKLSCQLAKMKKREKKYNEKSDKKSISNFKNLFKRCK